MKKALENKTINLLYAIAYVFEEKNLAVTLPIGKMVQQLSDFNPSHLGETLNGGVSIALPCDAVGVAESRIEPIRRAFGKNEDEAFPMIIAITDAETEENIEGAIDAIEEYYPIRKHLEEKGYEAYGIYYVLDNIEKFGGLMVEGEANESLYTVDISKYNIEKMIETVRENFKGTMDPTFTPQLLKYDDEENEFEILIDLENAYEHIILNYNEILNHLKESSNNGIFIPFAVDDTEGNIIVCDSTILEYDELCSGDFKFYEDTVLGIIIQLKDNKIVFSEAEYIAGACMRLPSVSAINNSGDFRCAMLEFINSFKLQ